MTPAYDTENGFRELRYAMRREDPITKATVTTAEHLAEHLVTHFLGRDLRLVAEALVTAAASISTLTQTSQPGIVAVNVQAFAGLFLLEAHERQAAAS